MSLTDCSINLQHLVQLEIIGQLEFRRSLPKDIGILKNVESISFETDDKIVDLGILQACGSRLKELRLRGRRTFEQGRTTIIGLARLKLDGFIFFGSRKNGSEVAIALDAGVVSLKYLLISCEGRVTVTGKQEHFEQLWCGLQRFHFSYFSRLPHHSEDEVQYVSGIQTMLAAAKIRDVCLSEFKRPCRHPTLGLGSQISYNLSRKSD